MDNVITASFRWSADEMWTAQRVHMKYSREFRRIKRIRWTIVPTGMAFGIAILVQQRHQPAALLGLVCIIMSTALLVFPLVVRRLSLRQYAHRRDRDMVVNWEFRPDGIVSKTEASSETLEWSRISRVLQTEQGILLYLNDRVFHWLPVHAFRDPAELKAFAELAKDKVKRYNLVS